MANKVHISGFGDDGANGTYYQIGTLNNQALYQKDAEYFLAYLTKNMPYCDEAAYYIVKKYVLFGSVPIVRHNYMKLGNNISSTETTWVGLSDITSNETGAGETVFDDDSSSSSIDSSSSSSFSSLSSSSSSSSSSQSSSSSSSSSSQSSSSSSSSSQSSSSGSSSSFGGETAIVTGTAYDEYAKSANGVYFYDGMYNGKKSFRKPIVPPLVWTSAWVIWYENREPIGYGAWVISYLEKGDEMMETAWRILCPVVEELNPVYGPYRSPRLTEQEAYVTVNKESSSFSSSSSTESSSSSSSSSIDSSSSSSSSSSKSSGSSSSSSSSSNEALPIEKVVGMVTALTPDPTGPYVSDGTYGGQPCYKHQTLEYYIYYGGDGWYVSSVKGDASTTSWKNATAGILEYYSTLNGTVGWLDVNPYTKIVGGSPNGGDPRGIYHYNGTTFNGALVWEREDGAWKIWWDVGHAFIISASVGSDTGHFCFWEAENGYHKNNPYGTLSGAEPYWGNVTITDS